MALFKVTEVLNPLSIGYHPISDQRVIRELIHERGWTPGLDTGISNEHHGNFSDQDLCLTSDGNTAL